MTIKYLKMIKIKDEGLHSDIMHFKLSFKVKRAEQAIALLIRILRKKMKKIREEEWVKEIRR